MDVQTAGIYGGIISLILHAAQGLFQLINHTRVRSNCCGRKAEMSLDVEKTDPIDK